MISIFIFALMSIIDPQGIDFLSRLNDKYSIKMLHIAYSILSNHHDAEDAVQDTLIKVYRNIDKFKDATEESVIKQLTIFTLHSARDIQRKKSRRPYESLIYEDEFGDVKENEIADDAADVENIVLNREVKDNVAKFIDSLPMLDRHIMLLKYHGYKDREIAAIVNISESNVSTRINRIKKKLRAERQIGV